MANPNQALKLAFAIVACMALIGAPRPADAMGCNRFLDLFTKCIYYARGLGPLEQTCCDGLRTINAEDSTVAARRATCTCMVNSLIYAMALSQNPLNPTLAAGIPARCGVSLPYPISISANCNGVQQIGPITTSVSATI